VSIQHLRVVRPWHVVVVLAAQGCGGTGADATAMTASEVVVGADFNGFCNWSSAPATAPGDASDGIHGLGPLVVYWKQPPPHGSPSFPVGTLIVKESQETDVTKRTVFAMAKVGGSYNSDGAPGWEWFSFAHNADCSVTTLWSGPAAPPGETYSGMPVGNCNGCHESADNDFVWDTALQLSNF
jgi:hypothetical protein